MTDTLTRAPDFEPGLYEEIGHIFTRRIRIQLVDAGDYCRYVPRRRAGALDRSGEVLGELTLLYRDWIFRGRSNETRARYWCRCSCGKELSVRWDHLNSGATVACGHIARMPTDARYGDMNPERAQETTARLEALRAERRAAVEALRTARDPQHTASEYRELAAALHRRGDKPEEYWINAALARIFGEGV